MNRTFDLLLSESFVNFHEHMHIRQDTIMEHYQKGPLLNVLFLSR